MIIELFPNYCSYTFLFHDLSESLPEDEDISRTFVDDDACLNNDIL